MGVCPGLRDSAFVGMAGIRNHASAWQLERSLAHAGPAADMREPMDHKDSDLDEFRETGILPPWSYAAGGLESLSMI